MSNQSKYEKIDNYLNGMLSGNKLADFEQEINSDEELATLVTLFQEMDIALVNESALGFQKIVEAEDKAFFAESTSNENQGKSIIRQLYTANKRWLVAASLLLMVVNTLLFWQLQSNKATSNEELFTQYSNTYPLNSNVRGNDALTTDFQKGIQQYQAKNFSAATQIFESLVTANEQDMSLVFCLANAYFNQIPPQHDLAMQQFQKIISNDSSIYVTKSKWYLALIWLQKGKLEETKNLLKEVEQSGDKLAKKAKKLLGELEGK